MKLEKFLRFFCGMGVSVFLFFLAGVYSFYAPEGYIQIATHKYTFYKTLCLITAGVTAPAVLLYYIMLSGKKRLEGMRRLSTTDLYMSLYLLLNIISFCLTNYREEALWGTDGWYMGFGIHLFFIATYFFVSRFYDGKADMLPFFMAVTFLLFLWGLLNRFSVYPIDMQYESAAFISSMGNINWFCGFWSVFFVTGVVLYVITEKRRLRIFSGIYSVLALGLGAVEGSDSAFLSLGAVFFLLFWIAFQKTNYMKRLLEEGIFYCAACQAMRLVTVIAPESLNREEILTKLMLGNLTLAGLILFVILRILLERKDKEYKKYIAKNKKAGMAEAELIWAWNWLKYAAAGLLIGIALVYLALLIINTKRPGSLGFLSKYSVFLFDGRWGSSRGMTWKDGLRIYQSFSFKERLFGAGQDCFAIYAYNVPELAAHLQGEWPSSRLTNAHNECITYLVNIGVFGMLSFICVFWSGIKRFLEKAKKEPLCYVFAASLLSYFIHNQFSFTQVLNAPYVYMMLGLGEGLIRRGEER